MVSIIVVGRVYFCPNAVGSQARQQEVVSGAGTDPAADLRRQEEEGALSPKSLYQKNKVAREQLSLQLLMHLNGEQMASIKVREADNNSRRFLVRIRSFPQSVCVSGNWETYMISNRQLKQVTRDQDQCM